MGCTASRPEGNTRLHKVKPWKIEVPSNKKGYNENDLQQMRKDFWDNRVEGDLDTWAKLKLVCEYMLKGKYQDASDLFDTLNLELPHDDLTLCIDSQGFEYRIEKYCFSNPSNMLEAKYERSKQDENINEEHEYKIRIQSTQLDEELPISVRIIPTESVITMKMIISKQISDKIKEEYPLERLRLIYMGQEMKANKEIKDYHIQPDSIIQGFLQI